MSHIRLRRATAADFRAYAGRDLPECFIEGRAVGYAAERGGAIVALGIITWDPYGRAWIWLDQREKLSAVMLHRSARAMIDLLRSVKEPALYAFCSQTIVGSEKWLRRLGFCPAPELTTDLKFPVFVCTLSN